MSEQRAERGAPLHLLFGLVAHKGADRVSRHGLLKTALVALTGGETAVDADLLKAKMRQTDVLSHPLLKRNTVVVQYL